MVDRDDIVAALPAYEIAGELGRGAFGVVLAGRHLQLHREVAIKWLGEASRTDREIRRRFVREARLLGGLDHPHVVPIYDFVDADGLLLLVMERLTGGTLSDRSDSMTPQVACGVIVAACGGLHHAHGRGPDSNGAGPGPVAGAGPVGPHTDHRGASHLARRAGASAATGAGRRHRDS